MANRSPKQIKKPPFIRWIEIVDLFGYLNYTIPLKSSNKEASNRLIMIYGDNGCGKTTILKLIYSLLSPQRGKGHKTYILETPFRKISICFDNDVIVSAERRGEALVGQYFVEIKTKQGVAEFEMNSGNEKGIGWSDTARDLLNELRELSTYIYFLPDDRKATSTIEADEDENKDEISIYRRLYTNSINIKNINLSENRNESHHLNIEPVIDSVNIWFRRHAHQGTFIGEENATSLYLKIIQQVTKSLGKDAAAQETGAQNLLVDRLVSISKRIGGFTRFELIPVFPAEKFLDILSNVTPQAKKTITKILEPYIDSIEERLNALDSIRAILTIFIETLNSLLFPKTIGFTLKSGIVIRDYSGSEIAASLLSSGEKQLLLLFSNTILFRDTTGIFLIDEPELSLNVKWQRSLVDALLACAGDSVQFIMASHSLELITLHKSKAVRLFSRGKINNA